MHSTSKSQVFRLTLSLPCPSPDVHDRSNLDLRSTDPDLVSAADVFLGIAWTRRRGSTPARQVADDLLLLFHVSPHRFELTTRFSA